MPLALAFTVETDGRLPDGTPLAEAVRRTDEETGGSPAYYIVNCAHPAHFRHALFGGWVSRILGVRANASRRSHAELDDADALDAGDPEELGRDYLDLRARLPRLSVLGGCCGMDHRHIEAIARACFGDGGGGGRRAAFHASPPEGRNVARAEIR